MLLYISPTYVAAQELPMAAKLGKSFCTTNFIILLVFIGTVVLPLGRCEVLPPP